jgi:hypothetical protein
MNMQRNAITQALMDVGNPEPRTQVPQMPQLPMQQPMPMMGGGAPGAAPPAAAPAMAPPAAPMGQMPSMGAPPQMPMQPPMPQPQQPMPQQPYPMGG